MQRLPSLVVAPSLHGLILVAVIRMHTVWPIKRRILGGWLNLDALNDRPAT